MKEENSKRALKIHRLIKKLIIKLDELGYELMFFPGEIGYEFMELNDNQSAIRRKRK